jgi:hypothetical protein
MKVGSRRAFCRGGLSEKVRLGEIGSELMTEAKG